MMRRITSLLLGLVLVVSLAAPANAASVTINSRDSYTFRPGSAYSATDLFDAEFKNLMPGDKVCEIITITSGFYFKEDSLKVYMRAVPHNGGNLPVTGQNVAHMSDFLNQLTLRVYNLSKDGEQIFRGKANELDGLQSNVLLGTFRRGGKIQLKVELEVPINLGNEYANRVGEVDWVFTVEAFDDPTYDNPKTGDYIGMAAGVMAASAAAIVALAVSRKRKKQ